MLPRCLTADKLGALLEVAESTYIEVREAIYDPSESYYVLDKPSRTKLWEAAERILDRYIDSITIALSFATVSQAHTSSLAAWISSMNAVYYFAQFGCLYEVDSNGIAWDVSIPNEVGKALDSAKMNIRQPGNNREMEKLIAGAKRAFGRAREKYDLLAGKKVIRPSVIFLTALEHEFQSMVRRLEGICELTSQRHYGCKLRLVEIESMSVKKLTYYKESMGEVAEGLSGWAVGTLNGVDVAVICAGKYGAENIEKAMARFMARHAVRGASSDPPDCLCVVGICAATSDVEAKLGDVVLSSDVAFHVEKQLRSKSPNPWLLKSCLRIQPMSLIPAGATGFHPNSLFFAPPRPPPGAKVADSSITMYQRRFLISNIVIDSRDDREMAIRAVREECQKKCGKGSMFVANGQSALLEPGEGEWFGVEMECAGLGNWPPLIVKSVVDYADENKAGGWDEGEKLRVQLYAAEVAAETASRLVCSLSTT